MTTNPKPGARVRLAVEGTWHERPSGAFVMTDPDSATGEVFGVDVHPWATVTVFGPLSEVPAAVAGEQQ